MKNISICTLTVGSVIKRFYFMMAVAVIAGFLGQFTLAAVLAMAISVTIILGISFKGTAKKQPVMRTSKINTIESREGVKKAS